MRQASLQQTNPAAQLQERPKRGAAGVRAELLVGEVDLDRLAAPFDFNRISHRLVNRANAQRLRCFHSAPISSQSVAPWQLPRYGSGV